MRSILPISFVLLSSSWLQPAVAQNWGPLTAPPSPKDRRALAEAEQKKTRQKFKTSTVDKITPIPGVPEYPGGKRNMKFIRALKYSSLGQGDNCVVQSFLVKDPPDSVRQWYQGAVSASNGWTVQPANMSGTQILARRPKDGASVHIMVSECAPVEKKNGFKAQVQLRYVQWVPLAEQ